MHEKLISLRSLTLQGWTVSFAQAVLVWKREDFGVSWSGSVRGPSAEDLPDWGDQMELQAESLDGRTIEGQVLVHESEDEHLLAFVGIGALRVDGREL